MFGRFAAAVVRQPYKPVMCFPIFRCCHIKQWEKQDIFENNDNCVVTIKTTIPKEEELASNSDDDDVDDVDDIYKKAKKDYDDAYSKAKSDYDKAYKQAQKDLNDALDSYGW